MTCKQVYVDCSLSEMGFGNSQVDGKWWPGGMSTTWASTPDTLYGWAEERKGQTAAQPGHCWRIRLIPLYGEARSQLFVECIGFVCHATSGGQDKGSEGGVFDLPYALFVGPFLKHLLFSAAHCQARLPVGGSMWIEDANVKKCSFKRPPQKPFAAVSRRAPSWVFEVALEKIFPDNGYSSGSMQTSLHTWVNRSAVKSLISLWRIEGKPPFGQDSACSTENLIP